VSARCSLYKARRIVVRRACLSFNYCLTVCASTVANKLVSRVELCLRVVLSYRSRVELSQSNESGRLRIES
jgi:hypothetical protein